MKLECTVVKDLYPLYQENDISSSSKAAVDEHLASCEECRRAFGSGKGVGDILQETIQPQPPKKLDHTIMNRIKIQRLKIGIVMVTTILLVILYMNYKDSREYLLLNFSAIEHSCWNLSRLDWIKGDKLAVLNVPSETQTIDNRDMFIQRDLNFFEKKGLEKNQGQIFLDIRNTDFCKLLKNRFLYGNWSDRDEKAYNLYQSYIEDFAKSLEDERLRLNDIRTGSKFLKALLMPVNTKRIAEDCYKANQLSYMYSMYNKFPEEMKMMSTSELDTRVKSVLGMNNVKITFPEYLFQKTRSIRGFSVNDDKGNYMNMGTVDFYTGRIVQIGPCSGGEVKGELLSVEQVTENAKSFLQREYGSEFDWDLQFKGINYNYSFNTDIKVYCYQVQLKTKGFTYAHSFDMQFDARSGLIFGLQQAGYLDKPSTDVDTRTLVSKDNALAGINIDKDKLSKYEYKGTEIIHSALSWKYVIVHEFQNSESSYDTVFVNTVTGKREVSMFYSDTSIWLGFF